MSDGDEKMKDKVYGGCEGPMAMLVKLISADGHEFIIKREHALTSGTIKVLTTNITSTSSSVHNVQHTQSTSNVSALQRTASSGQTVLHGQCNSVVVGNISSPLKQPGGGVSASPIKQAQLQQASPLKQAQLQQSSPIKQAQLQQASPIKQAQLQQATPSSPRPSILIRKRIGNDGQVSSLFANVFKTTSTIANPVVASTAAAASETVIVKTEVIEKEVVENAASHPTVAMPVVPLATASAEPGGATPRKKPRKQLLEPFNMSTSQNIKLLNSSDDSNRDREDDRDTDEASEQGNPPPPTATVSKKPRPSLLGAYNNTQWKSLEYHFLRYNDVKPKPEKKLTLSELSNEGVQKKNGWKIHHLATQMEEMSDNEAEIHERLTKALETFEQIAQSLDSNGNELSSSSSNPGQITVHDRLTDLVRGNLQRSNLFQEQITESKTLLIKLTQEHRERVGKLTKKCANKRTFIQK